MKKYPKKLKIAVFAAAFAVGAAVYFAAYAWFESQMTDWQKSQEISFEKNTGSTKFKAHVDALVLGGAAFCAASAASMLAAKIILKK